MLTRIKFRRGIRGLNVCVFNLILEDMIKPGVLRFLPLCILALDVYLMVSLVLLSFFDMFISIYISSLIAIGNFLTCH